MSIDILSPQMATLVGFAKKIIKFHEDRGTEPGTTISDQGTVFVTGGCYQCPQKVYDMVALNKAVEEASKI